MSLLDVITRRDLRLMRLIHGWQAPRWLRVWMVAATRGGDGWLWFTIGLLIALFGGPYQWRALGASAAAASVGTILFLVLKRLTGRERPCAIQPHCWATLLPPDRFSFPSGHSIFAFAAAICVGQFYPSLFWGLLFCAASIAASRVLLGLHFLSDVVVGSVLGAVLGYTAYWYAAPPVPQALVVP